MRKLLLSIFLLFILTGQSHAVVSSTINQNEYACNSSNTLWNYTFPIILPTDIQVYTIDSMGNATQQTSNFSVNTNTLTVTYPVTGTPCATGYSLLLERIEPFTQLVAASNQGPAPSPVVMTMSDKLTMLAQQLSNNSVQSSPGTAGNVVLPAYSAGSLLAWSSTLNQLVNVSNPSAVAQWTLSGANISYNNGNVSTTKSLFVGTNIGIGTTVPGQALDVLGTIRGTAFNANGGYTQTGTASNVFTGLTSFSNATNSALFTGGNVGIGSVTPGQELDVQGTIRATSFSGPGILPSGAIIMWSGSIASIPTGFVLCNGSNGTPDLRNRFIVGANADVTGTAESTITGSAAQTSEGQLPATTLQTFTASKFFSSTSPAFSIGGDGINNFLTYTPAFGTGTANVARFYALAYIMKT